MPDARTQAELLRFSLETPANEMWQVPRDVLMDSRFIALLDPYYLACVFKYGNHDFTGYEFQKLKTITEDRLKVDIDLQEYKKQNPGFMYISVTRDEELEDDE